jgi:hypothetical protein
MNRRFIAYLSIFTIAVSVTTIPAKAAVKEGGICTKAGAKRVSGSKTHTCIKSGKRLIWDKGVAKSPNSHYLEIPISLDNLDLIRVPQKAYENVTGVLKTRSRSNFSPIVHKGPNVKTERSNQELPGLFRAIDLWAPYFQPEKFQVVFIDKGDEEWLEKKSTELGLGSLLPPGQTWTERMKMYSPCGFGNAGTANEVPTYVQCVGMSFIGGKSQGAPHEYTHLFQQGIAGSNQFRIPWYTEGTGSFFGWTLGFYPYDPKSSERNDWLKILYWNIDPGAKSDFESKNIEFFKKRIKSLIPSYNESVASTSYWVGGLAVEVLVALYGFDKFIEFSKNIKNIPDMSQLLAQTYGFNEDYFYEKLAPYVWAQIPA